MIEKVKELYNILDCICLEYYADQTIDIVGKAQNALLDISKVSEWILKQDISEETKYELKDALKDCVSSIENIDKVLMYDSVKYGIMKILSSIYA